MQRGDNVKAYKVVNEVSFSLRGMVLVSFVVVNEDCACMVRLEVPLIFVLALIVGSLVFLSYVVLGVVLVVSLS